MTLNRRAQSNFSTEDILTPNQRIVSENDINVTFAVTDSAAVLSVGYPVGYNESTGNHAPWMAPNPTILTVDMGATTPATGGTWGVTVNDEVIPNTTFAHDVSAAIVSAAIKAIGYENTVVETSDVYVITFNGEDEIKVLPTVSGDVTQLTGATGEDATATAGTATNGTHNIRGFIHPNVLSIGTVTGDVALVVLTGTDTVCTATQTTPHGLVTGMSLTMSGATESKLNITATITVTTSFSYTYTVAAVSGGTVDSGAYTTTNQSMVLIMVKGQIHATLPEGLVASGDLTALRTALKDSLLEKGITVQGLAGRY